MMLVRLQPAALRSRVKHSTTEPLHSHLLLLSAELFKKRLHQTALIPTRLLMYKQSEMGPCCLHLHLHLLIMLANIIYVNVAYNLSRQHFLVHFCRLINGQDNQ